MLEVLSAGGCGSVDKGYVAVHRASAVCEAGGREEGCAMGGGNGRGERATWHGEKPVTMCLQLMPLAWDVKLLLSPFRDCQKCRCLQLQDAI